MRRPLQLALALAALLGSLPAAGEELLGERLEAVLKSRALRGAQVGALVVSAKDGRVLFAHQPERALVPASNLKVLTSIAALQAFGPTHRFETEILSDAPPDAQGAVEYLAIRGNGDPGLTSEELWRLASEVRRRGVRVVRAGLRLDDSALDSVRWHPNWGVVSSRAYHAPIGALTANYGAYAVVVQPGVSSGDPVRVALEPAVPFLRLSNRATTGPRRAKSSLSIEHGDPGAAELVSVSGVLPAGGESLTLYRSVRDPLGYAGAVIRMQLEAVGIEVAGETRGGPIPAEAQSLLVFEGRPLSEIVRLVLKFSSNPIAETLVKLMGARAAGVPGSWENGIEAMRAQLVLAGIDTQGLRIVDGSGLSYDNRATARAFVDALRLAADSFRFGPEFVSGLPIASADGTLKKRADGAAHAVRAKTGLLTRVTALSGYAQRPDSETAIFSILVNGYRRSAEEAMGAVDEFVAALVTAPIDARAVAAQEF